MTWRICAEAYDANARDFGISTSKCSLPAIMQWHLNYEGPRLYFSTEQEFSQDPLVLVPELPAVSGVPPPSVYVIPSPGDGTFAAEFGEDLIQNSETRWCSWQIICALCVYNIVYYA